MFDLDDFFEFFLPVIVLLAVLAAIFIGLATWHGSYQCSNYEDMTGKQSNYRFMDTCYVQHKGEWKRWDEYKAIQREIELK